MNFIKKKTQWLVAALNIVTAFGTTPAEDINNLQATLIENKAIGSYFMNWNYSLTGINSPTGALDAGITDYLAKTQNSVYQSLYAAYYVVGQTIASVAAATALNDAISGNQYQGFYSGPDLLSQFYYRAYNNVHFGLNFIIDKGGSDAQQNLSSNPLTIAQIPTLAGLGQAIITNAYTAGYNAYISGKTNATNDAKNYIAQATKISFNGGSKLYEIYVNGYNKACNDGLKVIIFSLKSFPAPPPQNWTIKKIGNDYCTIQNANGLYLAPIGVYAGGTIQPSSNNQAGLSIAPQTWRIKSTSNRLIHYNTSFRPEWGPDWDFLYLPVRGSGTLTNFTSLHGLSLTAPAQPTQSPSNAKYTNGGSLTLTSPVTAVSSNNWWPQQWFTDSNISTFGDDAGDYYLTITKK